MANTEDIWGLGEPYETIRLDGHVQKGDAGQFSAAEIDAFWTAFCALLDASGLAYGGTIGGTKQEDGA